MPPRSARLTAATVTPGHTPGAQPLARWTRPSASTAISAGEPASGLAEIRIPASRRVDASRPGSISAGASSARSSTSFQSRAGTRLPVT